MSTMEDHDADQAEITDYWGEHPRHSASAWQAEVASGDTRLGYWEWGRTQDEDTEEREDTHCRECGEEIGQAGDGWDGMCGDCADGAESEAEPMSANKCQEALREASAALSVALDRLHLNNCAGEEAPFIEDVRTARRMVREALAGPTISYVLNERETCAILAGLRCWQGHLESGTDPYAVEEIHEDGGRIEPLTVDEIDALCERLNR